ncbi:MAG TPA: CUAEP/CCAEP-tail radical SAM protein [bacterium]|nr:CUAEP/CCAEP-tail radical SAM protein [bacterium]
MTATSRNPHASFRAPGAILLLSCYELGHAPLGLASPMGFLNADGFRPALQDLATERLDAERVAQARFVGISVPMHTALRLGLRVSQRVRELNPTAHVCFYGLYAGLNADLLLEGPADSVIGGEYEPALVGLLEALEGGDDLQTVAGISTDGTRHPPRLDRTAFAAPARSQLRPLTSYAHLELPEGEGSAKRTVGYVEASRGCKHLCRHCPIPPAYGGRFFVVPREVLLADIEVLVAQGAQHITFGDPDFLNGPSHALRLVQALHERFPDLTYDATIKVEHLLQHRALLPELARTGCLFIVTAAESLSETVLAHLDKGHTRADLAEAIAAVRAAGIAPRPTWVPFTPWTTLEDYLELLAFVRAERLIHHVDPVQYAIRLLVPPGSALLDTPQLTPHLGALDAEALTYTWRHPDPRMDALQTRVAALVESAATQGEDPAATFRTVYDAALAAAGQPALAPDWLAAHGHPPAPRLSEPWFC